MVCQKDVWMRHWQCPLFLYTDWSDNFVGWIFKFLWWGMVKSFLPPVGFFCHEWSILLHVRKFFKVLLKIDWFCCWNFFSFFKTFLDFNDPFQVTTGEIRFLWGGNEIFWVGGGALKGIRSFFNWLGSPFRPLTKMGNPAGIACF